MVDFDGEFVQHGINGPAELKGILWDVQPGLVIYVPGPACL